MILAPTYKAFDNIEEMFTKAIPISFPYFSFPSLPDIP